MSFFFHGTGKFFCFSNIVKTTLVWLKLPGYANLWASLMETFEPTQYVKNESEWRGDKIHATAFKGKL